MALTLLAPGVHAQTPLPVPEMESAPVPAEPPQAGRGRLLYAQNCAPCHGATGQGDGPVAADLPGPATAFADPANAQSATPADWFLVAKYGRMDQMMPPWESRMNDREIWQTVYYAWSLHLDETALAQAADRYTESCAACHGPQGTGDGPDAPASLSSFADPGYTMHVSAVNGEIAWQAAHPEIGGEWATPERLAMLEYMRTFSYTPPWQTVALEGEGVIHGQVGLGTPGAEWPDALEVRLEAYLDFELVEARVAPIDAGGAFRFEGLALDPDVVYLAVTGYDDVQYSSPVLTLSETQPTAETQILLYARTNDPSGLYIERANWVVEPQPEGLLVGQILNFGLTGDRAFTGAAIAGLETPVTVGVYVPPTAQDVRLENGILGGRYHQQGNIVYDTVPIAPGAATHQLVLRYLVPIDAEPMTLRNEFIYPVTRLNLLIADLPQVEVNAPGLESMGVQDFQGTGFQVWQAADLAAGPTPVHFFGLGAMLPGRGSVGNLQLGVIFGLGGAVTLLLLTALTVSWRRGRFRTVHQAAGLEEQRIHLLQSIARLDDLHAAGALDEMSWQQRRAQLKIQVLDVAVRLRAQAKGEPAQENGEAV